jgi:hypothetical protein
MATGVNETKGVSMRWHLRHPSPAMLVALTALFFSLAGTGIAAADKAVPLAKRALFAVNSGKLQGKTAGQIAAIPGPATDAQTLGGKSADAIAATAGPASTAAPLVTYNTGAFSLPANGEQTFAVACGAGERAISGGFTSPNAVLSGDTLPASNGTTWQIYLINLSSSQPASGTAYAICMK